MNPSPVSHLSGPAPPAASGRPGTQAPGRDLRSVGVSNKVRDVEVLPMPPDPVGNWPDYRGSRRGDG